MEGVAEEDDVMFNVQRPNASMTSASLCDAIIFGQSLVIATKSAPTHVTYFACDVNELVTSRGNTPVAWQRDPNREFTLLASRKIFGEVSAMAKQVHIGKDLLDFLFLPRGV